MLIHHFVDVFQTLQNIPCYLNMMQEYDHFVCVFPGLVQAILSTTP